MTAEIGMLNKYAVALAADSAVTVSGNNGKSKVYNSANKLFKLSNYEPIGIMIYGNASFMGVPWETIIKLYNKKLAKTSFKLVEDYAKDFLDYVIKFVIPESDIKNHIRSIILQLISVFNEDASANSKYNLKTWIEEYTPFIEEKETYFTISEDCKQYIESILIPDCMDFFSIEDNYHNSSESITEEIVKMFVDLFLLSLSKDRDTSASGIVIAGFGNEEIYPSIHTYEIEGKIKDVIFYKKNDKKTSFISSDNRAFVAPFAQASMIETFINGINPDLEDTYQYEIFKNISEFTNELTEELSSTLKLDNNTSDAIKTELNNKAKDFFFKKIYSFLASYKKDNHTMPLINAVSMLGKNDLAHMAESLVNIASMDKKMSMELESVGGPIDVAIISKGDGFIWFKRKHYFDINLNPYYFNKKETQC
ncbi:hypothetical protein [Aliarcobacter butzleri]|uniref:hypothetical protein n=2 Tax=Aliarcobacter butzleri TaxID=28197 RepID=UPI0021B48293|nr:hypothetical protein [Aliarcobacter butzleri]MCT7596409.1 hypothetical protein [Aliarcobacter butzleri]